jgi:hypothetical protein
MGWYPIPVSSQSDNSLELSYQVIDRLTKANVLQTNKIQHQTISKPNTVPRPQQRGGRHSTRAEKQISEDSLRSYLRSKGSPLADAAGQITSSPYSSTIIGICWIEQYGCTKAPGNNYWGIMCSGKVCRYSSLHDGIEAISSLLARYESKGKDTIESMRGYYCVNKKYPGNACPDWEPIVLKIKQQVESL